MGNQMDKVLPGLYVGRCPRNTTCLAENNITHILSVHDGAKPAFEGYVYKCIDIADSPSVNISDYFEECAEFIHNGRAGGGSVLIHCMAGVSRAVTMTVMYLMSISSLGYNDSLIIVKHCRSVAGPNGGFIAQLEKYEKEKVVKVREQLVLKYSNYDFEADRKELMSLQKSALNDKSVTSN